MSAISKTLNFVAALGLTACASSGAPEAAPAPAPAPAPAVVPAPAPTAPAGGAAQGAPAGLFSQAQANRGRDLLRSMCAECHTSAEFSDNAFKVKWSRRTVGDLFEFIHTNMPDNAPGILTEAQAADLVSYILSLNGFQPGSAQLAPDAAQLGGISLGPIRS